MALNASGAISLGGSTVGQSIALELNRSATAQICINCTAVRTLAGVASGAIAFNNFYGKSNGPTIGIYYGGSSGTTICSGRTNTVHRLNACGTAVGTSTSVGTAKSAHGGAGMPTNGMYWGGDTATAGQGNRAVRINGCGAIVGTETTPTSIGATELVTISGSKVGTNGMYIGKTTSFTWNVIRLNTCANLVAVTSVSGASVSGAAMATVGSNGVLYAGECDFNPCTYFNRVTRFSACATIVGSAFTTAGTARRDIAGATVGVNGLYYAGRNTSGVVQNRVTRINSCGTLVGSETTVGTARQRLAGAAIGTVGVFHGGISSQTITRINACGALVGTEGTSGFVRQYQAGASV